MIPKTSWPKYDSKLIKKINKILVSGKTNYLSGPEGKNFEKNFSKYFNIKYSIAVANCSIGLELALTSLNLKREDEVIVTPRSFYSSVSCVERVGLKPIFADIKLNTMNIDPESIKKKITKKTKAIICVHLYGMPCDMKEIIEISKKNNLKVIEDCSQAHGAKILDKYVGSFGDIAVFSFCQDKIISTGGEGGMITTNNNKYFNKIWSLKDIGKNRNKFFNIDTKSNFFPWVHDDIGTNARLTEIQSCIGNYQLTKLKKYLKKRNENANIFYNHFKNCNSIILPPLNSNITHAFYRFTIIIKDKLINRSKLMNALKTYNISCTVGGCPTIYKEKYFMNKYNVSNVSKYCKNAEFLKDKTICFLIDQTIQKKQISKICNILLKEINKLKN